MLWPEQHGTELKKKVSDKMQRKNRQPSPKVENNKDGHNTNQTTTADGMGGSRRMMREARKNDSVG